MPIIIFFIRPCTRIRKFVTCNSLNNYYYLGPIYTRILKVSEEFEDLWNYPQCIGSIDGKHIVLQSPMNSGSEFYNYKGFFSIVLFALVDLKYNFLFADTGCQGKISDGGVFRNTTLFKRLNDGSLNIIDPKSLPNREKKVPYVIVADEAFTLNENIMKPYSGTHAKGSLKIIYNYRHC